MKTIEDFEQTTEAVGVLAQGHVDLESIVHAQGEIIKSMDARIRLLTSLIDAHHEIFIKQGMARPRPAGDPLVN